MLGDVWLTAGSRAGTIAADGRLLPISTNQALFSLLGVKYGGNGTVTFAIPDLRGVAPKSSNGEPVNYVICISGYFPQFD
jgi:microcystin-dependent protein